MTILKNGKKMHSFIKKKKSSMLHSQPLNQMSDLMFVRTNSSIMITIYFAELLLLNTLWKLKNIGHKNKIC